MSAYLQTRERERRAAVQCQNEPPLAERVFEGCSRTTERRQQQNAAGPTHPLSVSFPHYLKGRNAVAAPAPHNAAALVRRQINGFARHSSPLRSQAPRREHEKAGRLCLPWGLLSEGQGLEADREEV